MSPAYFKPPTICYKNTLRSRASRKIRSILSKSKGRCHWCEQEIIAPRLVPGGDVIQLTDLTVTWMRNGEAVESLRATVDHVKELDRGGRNDDWNLVASCVLCNRKRSTPVYAPEVKRELRQAYHGWNKNREKLRLALSTTVIVCYAA